MLGSVMVIGGGIAGIQASLELADMGHKVYLVEKTGAIGGVMSQLDKTFPTNDCSICILSPKLVECGRHPNIEIITYADILNVEGRAGDFIVKVRQKARYVDVDKCIGCGRCAEKCPKKVPDEFNLALGHRKAIYVKYPQAVPLKYAIDKEHCIFFKKGKCKACEKFCPTGAINFDDSDKVADIRVGGIIIATGFDTFDPSTIARLNYEHPDVLTSLEFERILSASGPTLGRLLKPSDGKEPEKIAWIQCVGSRDLNMNLYCSSVCCMYAIKEAIIAKEHSPRVDCAIFFMDIRACGKDFEKYYENAKKHNIRFVRSRLHSIENSVKGSLSIRYMDETGRLVQENFDMVVLSVGIEPQKDVPDFSKKLGINNNRYGFVESEPFDPISCNREGVFVCGVCKEPKDVPESVVEGLAAATGVANLLRSAEKETLEEIRQPEKDVVDEKPRVGVFVCHCGINIASVVNVEEVRDYAKRLPHVVYAEDSLFTCSQDSQERIKSLIREHNLNRIVVASCSPRTHEPLFQKTIEEAGLNKYLFEMANIRDQCSWVHQGEPQAATEKAKDLIRMAVSKVALQVPLKEIEMDVTRSALVIGGGIAGMIASLSIAKQGYKVFLLEKGKRLGGNANNLTVTWDGKEVSEYLRELCNKVNDHPLIEVYLNAKIKDVSGFVGNFSTTFDVDGHERYIEHGVAIIAIGAVPYKPDKYLYGKDERVYLLSDMDQAIKEKEKRLMDAKSVVFIQCVGSRTEQRPYCSRLCCTHSMKIALQLKRLSPDMDIYILYRDIRTYGMREELYKEAREKGIVFIRYEMDKEPTVESTDSGLKIEVIDHILQIPVVLNADMLVLANGIVPGEDAQKISKLFKVPLNPEGFFLEAHQKLRPVDFATDGVFVAGLAHYPKSIEESIVQAKAAACRAIDLLLRGKIMAGGVVASINKDICSGCGVCIESCPFGAISYLEDKGYSQINEAVCKGCGTCAANCPGQAITLQRFTPSQIYKQIDSMLLEAVA